MKNCSRGAIWRRWDLHFHTPSSTGCYKNKSITNEDILDSWVKNEIAVVAITDHHLIDVNRYIALSTIAKEKGITVLPGIEFCGDTRGREPIHFIAIFPEDSDVFFIWDEINTRTDIAKRRKAGQLENQIYCNLISTSKIVKDLGGLISIHAGSKTNTIENITNSLPTSMAEKTEISCHIDIFEIGKADDQKVYDETVFPAIDRIIPIIICSDNHNAKDYIFKSKLWIKADPCFAGLKHVLQEPKDRVYIGDRPEVLERVEFGKTKYIKELRIDTYENKEAPDNIWFKSLSIPFNNELCAIIGNKGSGKSAIADIIGVCTDAEHSDTYQFLNKEKFKKKGYAERFYANVVFVSETSTADRPLSYNIDPSDVPKAKYLPQHYFEKVCNEIGKVASLREEIEKVVFQYIPNEKKLKKASFSELISFKKESIDSEIQTINTQIESLSKDIIELENKKSPEYKKNIQRNITAKKEELRVHIEQKPKEVKNPSDSEKSTESEAQRGRLKKWEQRKKHIESEIKSIEEAISTNAVNIEELEQLKRDVLNKVKDIQGFIDSKKDFCEKHSISIAELISIKSDISSIEALITAKKEDTSDRRKLVGTREYTDIDKFEDLKLSAKEAICNKEIAQIQSTLSQAEKNYQSYLKNLEKWESKKTEIEGSEDTPESLVYYKAELDYLVNDLKADLSNKRASRLQLSIQIYQKKVEIKNIYDSVKSGIDFELSTRENHNLTIDSSFSVSPDFIDNFMEFINKRKIGSFQGIEEGRKLFTEKILGELDTNDSKSLEAFLKTIINYLDYDKREPNNPNPDKMFIGDQVPKRGAFYDYLFSLHYLRPHYDLRQNGKSLDRLSPGEKGALLLVFYLVLDKSEIPLIIDQPEDNLDNNSVAQILVPFIKDAKKRRQIIMVTHNPNLAVVADAEQIIHVSIDKENGYKFDFSAGSIESDQINKAIVDVLEGTMPAFEKRNKRYHKDKVVA
jgi:ABC-type lipoprotein export system ATPase subunit/predicted metal-dependent phosphoesterase TrpH